MEGNWLMEWYMVAYAKITEDKRKGILLQGVYFGGIGDTLEDAEQIARQCVNEVRGGTIIPKVLKLQNRCKVIDAMHEAFDKFCDIADQMIEADKIISRTKNNKR